MMTNKFADFLGRMAFLRRSLGQIIIIAVILAAAYISYNLGATSGSGVPPEEVHVHEEHEAGVETIWTCSMHPEIRMEEPGDCPKCGMELIPEKVEAVVTEKKAAAEPIGYACAMNCVPPLPNPGKCPICGMDMVAIYDEAEGSAGTAATLTMSEEAAALADIQTTEVKRQWVENQISLTGMIDYDETRMSTISAYIDGRLDRLYVDYTGIEVRKGDHMVKLFSRNLLTGMEELVLARQAYERARKNNVTDLSIYQADINGSRERLRLWGLTPEQIEDIEKSDRRADHITIYAPMAGTVVKKHVNEGEYVKTGSPIYTVADFSLVWLKLKAYETDLPWLRYGQDVEFTTESYPGELFHGRISFIDPMLDQMSRTISVRVNVENSGNRLKPGMFVRATVKSRVAGGGKVMAPDLAGKWISPMHPEVIKDGPGSCDVCGMDLVPVEELGFVTADDDTAPLVIPAGAALITGKRAVAYVKVPGKDRPTFEGREITLGSRAGDYYLVADGLAEGERVVTNGAFKIDSALQIIAKPSMMNPEGGGTTTGHEHHQGSGTKTDDQSSGSAHKDESIDVSAEFRLKLEPVYEAYFEIQNALADDNASETRSGYGKLAKVIENLDTSGLSGHSYSTCVTQAGVLKGAAEKGAGTEDIKEARILFEDVSKAVMELQETFGHAGEREYFRVHCPMAFDFRGADWLQTYKEVRNPYFGAEMLECGVVKETFKPDMKKEAAGSDHKH